MTSNSRKSELKALFGAPLPVSQPVAPPVSTPADAGPAAPETKSAIPPMGEGGRTASGAVKAMGLSLNAMTREVEEARTLRRALEEGERIVSLDPAVVDGSFVEDRLTVDDRDDEDFASLIDSIRESGQQSPILVRPHPDADGRFQTAYGHRRLKAARRLGIAVKAIVRPLTDSELVLAQGKENAERRNLSFIERAMFAQVLVSRGFDRKVVGDALAVQKSELSRLLQVADTVPEHVVRAIGPAPKAGRERWMAIGTLLEREANQVKAVDEIHSARFHAADSDQRFQSIFNRLTRSGKPDPVAPEILRDEAGRVFAKVRRDGNQPRIEFAAGTEPDFIDSVAAILAERHAAFVAARRK